MEFNYTLLGAILAAGGILALLTYWRPVIGLALYSSSTALDYLLSLQGIRVGVFSVGQVGLVLLLAVSMVYRLRRPLPAPPPVRGLYVAIGLFVLAMGLSVLASGQLDLGLGKALRTTFTALVPFVVATLVRNRRELGGFLWAVGLGATFSASIGVLQYAGALPTYDATMTASDSSAMRGRVTAYRTTESEPGAARYAGPTENPNGFGAVLMGGIPALFYLTLSSRRKVGKATAASALGACLFALLLTMSRTHIFAFLLFAVVFTVPLVMTGRLPRWFVLLLAGAVLGGGLYGIQRVAGVRERMTADLDTSAATRREVMLGGLEALWDNPLFGIGLGATAEGGYGVRYTDAHDMVSGVAGEMGLVGVVTFGFLFWQGFRLAWAAGRRWRASDDPQFSNLWLLASASLAALLVSGFGNLVYNNRALWITLALCVVSNTVVVQQRAPAPTGLLGGQARRGLPRGAVGAVLGRPGTPSPLPS